VKVDRPDGVLERALSAIDKLYCKM
jgi:hypothetical protein